MVGWWNFTCKYILLTIIIYHSVPNIVLNKLNNRHEWQSKKEIGKKFSPKILSTPLRRYIYIYILLASRFEIHRRSVEINRPRVDSRSIVTLEEQWNKGRKKERGMIDRWTIRWVDRVVSIRDIEHKYNLMRIRKKSFYPGIFLLSSSFQKFNLLSNVTEFVRKYVFFEERRWRMFRKIFFYEKKRNGNRCVWWIISKTAPSLWSFIHSLFNYEISANYEYGLSVSCLHKKRNLLQLVIIFANGKILDFSNYGEY